MSCYQINGGNPCGGGSLFKGPRTVCCPSWGRRPAGPRREHDPQLSGPVRRDRYPGHPAPAGLRGEQGGGHRRAGREGAGWDGDPRFPDGGAAVLCDLPGGAADPDGGGGAVLPWGLRTGPAAHRPPSGRAAPAGGGDPGGGGQPPVPAGKGDAGGGSCASPCPAWGPQRTSCWPPGGCPAGPLWWGPPRSRRS